MFESKIFIPSWVNYTSSYKHEYFNLNKRKTDILVQHIQPISRKGIHSSEMSSLNLLKYSGQLYCFIIGLHNKIAAEMSSLNLLKYSWQLYCFIIGLHNKIAADDVRRLKGLNMFYENISNVIKEW